VGDPTRGAILPAEPLASRPTVAFASVGRRSKDLKQFGSLEFIPTWAAGTRNPKAASPR